MVLRVEAVAYDDPRAVALIAGMAAELDERYGPGGLSPASTSDFAPPGVFLVAEAGADGGPLGCGGLRVLEPGVGEVKRMYVDPAGRGRGTARRLLGELLDHARRTGLSHVRLETGTEQPEAVALYVSAGFLPIPPYGHYADDPRTRCFALDL